VRTLLIIAGCAIAAVAFAFTAFRDPNRQDGIRWSSSAVEVTIQQDGSDDIGDGSDITAIEQAVATWAAALSSGFTLTVGAPSSARDYGNDGINRITFIESGYPGGTDSALGTTIPSVVTGDPSRLVDVDILLNGEMEPWTVDGVPTGIDIQSVTAHELGHLVGLAHAYRSESVMYTGARSGTTFRRALNDDDQRGARLLTSAGLGCTEERDCPLLVGLAGIGGSPLRLTCNGTSCVPGAVGYGLDCIDNSDCTSGACLRDPASVYSGDPGGCTESCTTGSCPGGDLCKDVGGGNLRCVPGRSCSADSDCGGGANNKCLFDFDGHFRCRHLCMLDQHCTPPARCIDLDYGAGVCHEPGAAPNGAECLDPLMCMGLACRGNAQTLLCETAPTRQDGGTVPDVPHVGDGGWRPDAIGHDASGRDLWHPGYDGGNGYDSADDVGVEPEPPGCACASRTPANVATLLLLPVLAFAGRRRLRLDRVKSPADDARRWSA